MSAIIRKILWPTIKVLFNDLNSIKKRKFLRHEVPIYSTWDGTRLDADDIDDIFLTDDFIALYPNWFIFLMAKIFSTTKIYSEDDTDKTV